MGIKPSSTDKIIYHAPSDKPRKPVTESIIPIGLDTEAYNDGKLMMVCTSLGDIWKPDEWLSGINSRKYRGAVMVVYNLKYDMGALLQHLPNENLDQLRRTNKTEHEGIKYRVIANKLLSISKAKNAVHIYDIAQYYGGSLDHNAHKYLGEAKIDVETKSFSREYVAKNWDKLAKYCVHDAELTADLAKLLIKQLNSWGLHVTQLYSTAWISYQWFSSRCGHPSVGHFWRYDRRVLDYAMESYNGGKFEVTTKGAGYLYEYDIVSAYPKSISELLDLRAISVAWSKTYVKDAKYAFLRVKAKIPLELPSPVAIKEGLLNTYPAGVIERVITKAEYDYLIQHGADISILGGCWLVPDTERYLYKEEINHLIALKQEYKGKDELAYHTVKILMNSLYGKFVQLIEQDNGWWRAGSSWNPLYGSIITADTRVRISDMQRQYPSIWAVHTDSVISDKPLPFGKSNELGSFSYELEGDGIVVGCGIYEIGGKTAIRGVPSAVTLKQIAQTGGKLADVSSMQPISWRQALHRTHDKETINLWSKSLKRMKPNVDTKRVWIDDWVHWSEVLERTIVSVPKVRR